MSENKIDSIRNKIARLSENLANNVPLQLSAAEIAKIIGIAKTTAEEAIAAATNNDTKEFSIQELKKIAIVCQARRIGIRERDARVIYSMDNIDEPYACLMKTNQSLVDWFKQIFSQ